MISKKTTSALLRPMDQRTSDDCLRASVASIFGLPYDAVPQFGEHGDASSTMGKGYAQTWGLRAWCAEFGLGIAVMNDPEEQLRIRNWAQNPWGYCIASGKSPRGDWNHAVVWSAHILPGHIEHDPHPSRDGLVGAPQTYYCFELWNPEAFFAGMCRVAAERHDVKL